MAVDASAVARVLGISTTFVNLNGGSIQFLPMRIVILAQMATAVVAPTTKYQITSSGQAGSRYGWGSPIHLIAQQLFPDNGDGVGSIPVTVYPLVDAVGATAAAGDITPSGTTASAAAQYRIRVGGVVTDPFVADAGTIDVAYKSVLIGRMGMALTANLSMPVTVTYSYGGVTSTAGTNTGTGTCTALTAPGTPIPGRYTLTCTAAVTNGGVFQLVGPDGTKSTVTMTPGSGGATVLSAQGIQFTLTDAGTDFAVGDLFNIVVVATKVNVTLKWKGTSGNGAIIEVLGDNVGITFTVTQPNGGLVNPSVVSALGQMGNVWETLVINQMEITDTTTLDAINSVGEGRWGTLVHKPFVAFTGNPIADQPTAVLVSNSRKTDRINAQLVAPGSVNFPFIVAARQVARIAVVANNNPPTDYGAQDAASLIPGTDAQQWDFPTRDAAVKAGSSTVEVIDGAITISDVVTFYHPTGDPNPAYRYVVDIIKVMQAQYNLQLIFAAKEWAAAPLVPDNQRVTNASARRPKDAKAEVAAMIDSLGDNAIISDPATAKKTIIAAIDTQNPKRLNVGLTIQLAGNSNVKSIDLFFGFFFGTAQAA